MILLSVAEILVNGQENFQLEGLQIGAYILIGFGFLLNILPEDWHTTLLKLLRWKRPEARHQRESVSGRATPKPNRAQSGRATPKSRARSQAELNNSYCWQFLIYTMYGYINCPIWWKFFHVLVHWSQSHKQRIA